MGAVVPVYTVQSDTIKIIRNFNKRKECVYPTQKFPWVHQDP
jgi:hypothetical protein